MGRCPSCGSPVDARYSFCPACGTRLAEPSPRPSPGKGTPWLLPLIAAILAGILIAGVGAYYALQPVPPTAPADLTVSLLQPYFVGAVATINVGYVYPATSPQALLVSLSANGTTGAAVPMPATSGIGQGVTVTPGGYPFRIDWTDADSNGKLSTGDTFTITPIPSPPPCCLYQTFTLLRGTDGSWVAAVSFYGPPAPAVIPVVSLATPVHGTSTNVWIQVNYVDPATDPVHLRFQIVVGSVASPITYVQIAWTGSNASVGGGEYLVVWYDTNSDALVDAADGFNLTLVGGSWPASGTAMGFYLEWEDGTTLASATWTA